MAGSAKLQSDRLLAGASPGSSTRPSASKGAFDRSGVPCSTGRGVGAGILGFPWGWSPPMPTPLHPSAARPRSARQSYTRPRCSPNSGAPGPRAGTGSFDPKRLFAGVGRDTGPCACNQLSVIRLDHDPADAGGSSRTRVWLPKMNPSNVRIVINSMSDPAASVCGYECLKRGVSLWRDDDLLGALHHRPVYPFDPVERNTTH
jgi:hypothetical protein